MLALSGRVTQVILRTLDRISPKSADVPAHLVTGRRGEEDAYFYLRRRGYVIVARNYRTARHHGEIDLIGWDRDVLCFIEVKTRTTRDVKPAEAAVDRKKRHDLRIVIRDYLRTLPRKQFPELPPWRLDVVTVFYEREPTSRAELPTSAAFEETASQHPHPDGAENAPLRMGHPLGSECGALRPTFELFQNVALSS